MAVTAKKNMTVKQYDVKTAFQYGELEEIYLRQPCGDVYSIRACIGSSSKDDGGTYMLVYVDDLVAKIRR